MASFLISKENYLTHKSESLRGLLHHIEIYVADLEKAKNFWSWLLEYLGYSVYQQWNSGISWKLNDTYLVFVQVESQFLQNVYHRKNAGLNHIAFHVDSSREIDYLHGELIKRGVTILYEDKYPYAGGENYYAVYFEDQQRMKVEVVAGKIENDRLEKEWHARRDSNP